MIEANAVTLLALQLQSLCAAAGRSRPHNTLQLVLGCSTVIHIRMQHRESLPVARGGYPESGIVGIGRGSAINRAEG